MSGSASAAARSQQLVVSASARVRLDAVKAWLEAFPRDREVLVLVPHAIAADHVVHALVADRGSRFGVQRFTLNRLAAHLAASELARRQVLPCTDLSLTAVITRAVHRVVEEGKAGRLANVAKRPGFPRAIARSFKDLRSAAVSGDRVRTVADAATLAPFLDAVEAELAESRLVDRAEIFATALAVITQGSALFTELPVLLVNGHGILTRFGG
jgi:ATP-dependent helicase/nuclease subunit B